MDKKLNDQEVFVNHVLDSRKGKISYKKHVLNNVSFLY